MTRYVVICLTCRSHRLGCNHTADSLSPLLCPGWSSGAGPQKRGGPHTDWAPGWYKQHNFKLKKKRVQKYNLWLCPETVFNLPTAWDRRKKKQQTGLIAGKMTKAALISFRVQRELSDSPDWLSEARRRTRREAKSREDESAWVTYNEPTWTPCTLQSTATKEAGCPQEISGDPHPPTRTHLASLSVPGQSSGERASVGRLWTDRGRSQREAASGGEWQLR